MTRRSLLQKPIHRWFSFPHSFSSELVNTLLEEWNLTTNDLILDPFVGAGTTVLAAKERKISATGYDISPLARLVSSVKTTTYNKLKMKSLCDVLRTKLEGSYKCPPPSGEIPDLLNRALPGDLLHTFQKCSDTIDNLPCRKQEKDFFRLALIAVIPIFSRAEATGGWIRWITNGNDSSTIIPTLLRQTETMISDLPELAESCDKSWIIDVADARSMPNQDSTFTALITSPPYPNRHDYTRIYAVELLFAFLTHEQTKGLRQQSFQSHPEASPIRPDHTAYSHPERLLTVLDRLQHGGTDPRICRMLKGYFQDIYLCLMEACRVCKPGSHLAFVVGNVQYDGHAILVDEYIAELGATLGLQCKKLCVGRYRGNSSQQMKRFGRQPSRESVVVFKHHCRI